MRRLILFLLLAGAASADQFDSVRAFIRQRIEEGPAPSIAVAVARDGKIVWEEGFGLADRERKIAATPQTMYSLASISKPITATGLMILVQAGKVDLDRPVNDYLGSVKLRARVGDAVDATVRRVANHTSGLPLHYQFFYADEPYRPPPMDETIHRYGNLVTIPGEKFEYSNLGFGVLDYVIARVSGKPYEVYMREEVFGKLGLDHTAVGIPPGMEKLTATRYGSDNQPLPFYDFDHRGASAIFASAHDLVRFGMFHLKAHLADQAPILSDASIAAMHQPTASSGPHSGYAIGWGTDDLHGYLVISHTGGMAGVGTALRLVPSEKLAVVVLCNAGVPLPQRVADQIMAALLPKWKMDPDPPPKPAPVVQAGGEWSGVWTGTLSTYKADLPFELRIQPSGEIRAMLGGQKDLALSKVQSRNGVLSGEMSGDIGTEDANRRPYKLHLTLKLRGTLLCGPVSAISLPAPRTGNALTSWVELRKN